MGSITHDAAAKCDRRKNEEETAESDHAEAMRKRWRPHGTTAMTMTNKDWEQLIGATGQAKAQRREEAYAPAILHPSNDIPCPSDRWEEIELGKYAN